MTVLWEMEQALSSKLTFYILSTIIRMTSDFQSNTNCLTWSFLYKSLGGSLKCIMAHFNLSSVF